MGFPVCCGYNSNFVLTMSQLHEEHHSYVYVDLKLIYKLYLVCDFLLFVYCIFYIPCLFNC